MTDAPPDRTEAERRAEKVLKRHDRNLRKARAEGFLEGVAAMLRPGDLAMDCGANMGVVTAILARTGAEVMAFEPDPHAFAHLETRFADQPGISLDNAAVGLRAGTATLRRADNFADNPDGASVKSTILDGGRRMDDGHAVDVPIRNFIDILEAEIARRGEIAFVKMDIEGAELEILEELERRDMLRAIRCLVAETHERKFKELRPRYRALRSRIAQAYSPRHINLDWI
ncbi:FkbM family methyltransferase [Tranquillimonas rosea]|uniref:FkbM family methyltransferase n=1 Tax=Tranquillimonas rosea TaxID=641238 RepID=UPI003BAC0E0A